MAEGTSLTNEFNVKNQTLQATLEKIQKTVAGWMSSDTLLSWLIVVVEWFAKLIGATEDADGSGKKWREGLILAAKIITILVVGIGSYNAGMKLYVLWTSRATAGSALWNIQMRIQNALAAISIIKTQLMAAANALFTKGVKAAIVEIRTMNAVLGVSPWGAVAALIGLAVSALVLFNNESEDAISNQKMLNKVNADAEKSIAGQRKEIELLLKVARDENLEKSKRISALNELNRIIPGYNDLLNLEKINTLEASAAVKRYTDELYKNARAKALQSKFDELEGQKIDVEQKTTKDYRSGTDKVFDKVFSAFGVKTNEYSGIEEIEKFYRETYQDLPKAQVDAMIQNAILSSGLLDKKAEIDDIKAQQKIIEAEMLKMLQEDPSVGNDNFGAPETPGGTAPTETSTDKKKDKAKSDRQKRIDELIADNKKLAEELLDIQRANEDAQLDIMEEGFQKEQNQIQSEHVRRVEDLKKQIIDAATIAKLEEEKAAASRSGDTKKAGLLDEMIKNIKLKNEELNNSILQSTLTYEYRRGQIHAKYANQRLKELEKDFEDESKAREVAFMEELVQLGTVESIKQRLKDTLSQQELSKIKTWEQAKAALRAEYDKEEIEAKIQHTKDLLAEMQSAVESGTFQGFDVSLMTEEEKQKFIEEIELLKQKLIEFGLIKADILNGGSGSSESGTSGSENYGMGGQTDILGMTPENWLLFFENIEAGKFELEELNATVGLLQNAFQSYYALVQANEQRNLSLFEQNANRKRTALDRQLKQGIISQEQYDRKLEKLNEETDRKRAKMEYEAAMRAWKMNLGNAIVSAAMATLNGFNTTPFMPLGIIMGALAATLGTLQVATVMKNKPVKGYEKGLYPVIREQDGKYFDAEYGGETRSGMVNKPTLYLAGERGPEMIIDNQAFRQFAPGLKQDLFREIGRVKGFENGYYPSQSDSGTGNSVMVEDLLKQNIALMAQNNMLLQQMNDKESRAYLVLDYEEMKKLKEREEEYQMHLSKNRI